MTSQQCSYTHTDARNRVDDAIQRRWSTCGAEGPPRQGEVLLGVDGVVLAPLDHPDVGDGLHVVRLVLQRQQELLRRAPSTRASHLISPRLLLNTHTHSHTDVPVELRPDCLRIVHRCTGGQ